MVLLSLIIAVCTGIDIWSTYSILQRFGVGVELNPLVSFLYTKLGAPSLSLSIGGPTFLIWCVCGGLRHSIPDLLPFFAGTKFLMSYLQVLRKGKLGF